MKTVKLGDVCEIIGGGTPSKSEPNYWGGDIRWASVRDMRLSVIKTTEFKITRLGLLNSSTNLIPAKNVIIASRVGLGKICWIEDDTAINQDLRAIIPKNDQELSKNFLFWWLRSAAERIVEAGTGATVQGVTLPFLKNLEIPLPTLSEQRRIVERLDAAFEKIDRAIELTERNKKNVNSLFESKFRQIFESIANEKSIAIKDLAKTGAGGTPNKSHKEYYENGNIPWLRSGEVNKMNIISSELKISEQGLKNSSAKVFPKDSVLIAMYGATAGQVGILRFESATNQAICAIYPNDNVWPEYIYYALRNQKNNLLSQAVGNAQPNVSQIKIKNLVIPDIDVLKQKVVAEQIKQLDLQSNRLITNYNLKIKHMAALKQSLLSEAFTESDVK